MKQWAKRAAWPAAGLALGLAVFLAVYGPLPLEVTNDSWLLGGYVETDLLQHYAGWLAIKNQGLSWPLTFTAGLDWPVGGAAALADCIPLLAVPFGLVRAWLPATFQYFGWFVCGSLMLQGEAAVRLAVHQKGALRAGGGGAAVRFARFAGTGVPAHRPFGPLADPVRPLSLF